MVNRKKRSPKTGDRVMALGETGTFVIYSVDKSLRTAELKLMGGDLRLSSMPWDVLTLFDKEDASRAATTIAKKPPKRLTFPTE
jgi:hypothetical protein